MSQRLWQPSEPRNEQAHITRFTRAVEAAHGIELPDYQALHDWSVAVREGFWGAMWDFGEVVASQRGERVLVDGDKMPGAR